MCSSDLDILFFLDQKTSFPEWVKVLDRPEEVYFVASADSPLAGEKNIPIERILEEPLFLTEKGIKTHKAYVGNYFTSLEMMGATLTVMKLDDELKELIDMPAYSMGLKQD